MTTLSWIADTTTKLALGAVIGTFFKTWFDANMTLRLREHNNASHLRELHQQGVQLRLHFARTSKTIPCRSTPSWLMPTTTGTTCANNGSQC